MEKKASEKAFYHDGKNFYRVAKTKAKKPFGKLLTKKKGSGGEKKS